MDILKNPAFMMKDNQSSYEYTEYQEDNGGTSQSALNIPNYRITVPASDDMVLMADSFLQVRGNIRTRTSDVNYTAGKIALVNCGWNLFDEAKYKINSRIIETVDHPGEVRNVKGLIEYSEDYVLGQGQAELFIPDNEDGGISSNITLFNITQNYEILRDDFRFTAANPHLFNIVDNNVQHPGLTIADDDTLEMRYNGKSITVIRETLVLAEGAPNTITKVVKPELLKAVGTTPAQIRVTNSVVGDVIRFYVEDQEIFLLGSNLQNGGVVTNATPEIVFNDGTTTASAVYARHNNKLSNEGYEQRRIKSVIDEGFNTSQSFELYMPIRRVFKFMQEHPIMLKGASHIVEFKRNNFESMLFSEAVANLVPAQEPAVRLNYMSLWVPKIKLSLQYESLYLDSIGDQSVRFEWDTYEWERSDIFTSGSGSHDVATVSGIPKRMYIVFQKSSRFDDHTQNNMVYDNMDLQEVYVKLNSQRFPEYEYEINYGLTGQEGEKIYMRSYNAYLNACQVTHSDSCKPFVSYTSFKRLYPIYCFDLRSKDLSVFKNGSNIQIKVFWRLRNYTEPYRITTIYEENVETEIKFLSGNVSKLR